MPAGFIFDLDGVITDTAEYHYHSWKMLAEEEGLSFTREDNEALRGVPRRRSLELLLKGRSLPEARMLAMMQRKNDHYRSLLPGAATFLQEAKQTGVLLGLGSASKNAREVCDRLSITHLFDAFGDGYSVVNAKPAPDLFLWVAGGLRLPPEQCVVFEDAEAGIEAALIGGFWTVGIGPHERVGQAHRVLPGLENVRATDFLPPLR